MNKVNKLRMRFSKARVCYVIDNKRLKLIEQIDVCNDESIPAGIPEAQLSLLNLLKTELEL